MNFKPIFYINGILLLTLSTAMLLPALVDLAHGHEDWKVFAGSQIITAFVGFALIFTNRQKQFRMTLKETFVLTSVSWVTMAVFASLPFCLSEMDMSFDKAFFEAMSGLTTTGATVISGLDSLPQGILFWRALMQWIGGIGFLIVALAVLPMLQISGMQIFRAQSFGDVEKVLPSASQMAIYICIIYAILTVICGVLLHFAGLSLFDAFCHAMSTVATGGFSTSDNSIGNFKNPLVDYITIIFMLIGAMPFVLYVRMLKGDNGALASDSQVRAFLGIVFTLAICITLYLTFTGRYGVADSFRNALFMITTLMTTSGFANADYTQWGPFAIAIAFLATFLGSCSGSTSGGIKVFRLQILWSMTKQQVNKLIHPHGVFHVHYNKKIVDAPMQAAIAGFIFVFLASWLLFGILLQLTGLDFTTAFTGALTAVSNVGPGLGHIIGPAGNFSTLDADALWILSAGMLLGRVEFFTLLVLLSPRFWKD